MISASDMLELKWFEGTPGTGTSMRTKLVTKWSSDLEEGKIFGAGGAAIFIKN